MPHNLPDFWTDERIAELEKLWRAGLTTEKIARQIGCTKNAVIGKAHRLGLRARPTPILKRR
jgi:GcrA cell cycle regulator